MTAAYLGENYSLGNIKLDKDKAEKSGSDIHVTFKSSFFSGYKYSIDYKPHEIIISGPILETKLVTKKPEEILAQKFGVSVTEWNNPSLDFALKIFEINKDYLNISSLDERTKEMIDIVSKAKARTIAEKEKACSQYASLFASKIAELNEMLAFIGTAHKVLLSPIPLLSDSKKNENNGNILQLIFDATIANNE